MSTPDLDCEAIGFRQWRVDKDMRLTGAHITHPWNPGENRARCVHSYTAQARATLFGDTRRAEPHHAPGSFCECGFYALHAPDFWYGESSYIGGGDDLFVAGLVAGWGRIEVHRTGFRAEFARVVAVAVPAFLRDATLARAVAAKYGVPTIPQHELEQVATEFGQRMPEHLLPEVPKPSPKATVAFSTSTGGYFIPSTMATVFGHWYEVGTTTSGLEFTASPATSPVDKARSKRPKYDPRAFLPKRKGGSR